VKHTPGPWEVGRHHENTSNTPAHYAISQYGELYDHAHVFAANDGGEGKANARLISAAPELLKACKEAMLFIDELKNHGIDHWTGESKLWQAINKAEGR
jgi:hypothetical protein